MKRDDEHSSESRQPSTSIYIEDTKNNFCDCHAKKSSSSGLESMHLAAHRAIKNGDFEKVKNILDQAGQNALCLLMMTNKKGNTLFHLAAMYEQAEILNYLIDGAGDLVEKVIMWQNNDGYTVLHFAARYNNGNMTQAILLAANRQIEELLFSQNDGGDTALLVAVMFVCDQVIEKMLFYTEERSKLVELANKLKLTPVSLAKHHGLYRIYLMLTDPKPLLREDEFGINSL